MCLSCVMGKMLSIANTEEPLWSGLRLTVNSINCATLLRAVLEEDTDLCEFYKKWTIKDAIFSCSDRWNDIPSVALRKSW
jgi:hypothetical protein